VRDKSHFELLAYFKHLVPTTPLNSKYDFLRSHEKIFEKKVLRLSKNFCLGQNFHPGHFFRLGLAQALGHFFSPGLGQAGPRFCWVSAGLGRGFWATSFYTFHYRPHIWASAFRPRCTAFADRCLVDLSLIYKNKLSE
jgi:hypothetical protein